MTPPPSKPDPVAAALVDALKLALGTDDAIPLFKSGKQAGLFESKDATAAEAAKLALRDQLIDIVRTETKGKAETQWVRITPRGVQFLYQHESPKAVLAELVDTVRLNRDGMPRWVETVRAQLQAVTNRFTELIDRQEKQLEHLARRADEALKRLTAGATSLNLGAWQLDAIDFLDSRRAAGIPNDCTLPELFQFLRDRHPDLSITSLHEGLTLLRDRGAIELVAYAGHLSELTEPEYALLEGARVYVAIRRT